MSITSSRLVFASTCSCLEAFIPSPTHSQRKIIEKKERRRKTQKEKEKEKEKQKEQEQGRKRERKGDANDDEEVKCEYIIHYLNF